jgi:hypothetical protein
LDAFRAGTGAIGILLVVVLLLVVIIVCRRLSKCR